MKIKNSAVNEQAIVFGCEGEPLVGIVHAPQRPNPPSSDLNGQPSTDLGIVIIVGGPQYRAGSHRQFVLLARALAAAGYPVLRFDYRGMGDSSGAARSFEQVNHDIEAAIDTLQQQQPSAQRVVLWGLCDGASAALLYAQATRDARVSGACVLNPWVRSDATLAVTQLKHYYGRRLLAPEFWAKLLSGKVASNAMLEVMQKMRLASAGKDGAPAAGAAENAASQSSFQQRMAQGWQHLGERVLLILSGNDYTAKEFIEHSGIDRAWRELLAQPSLQRHTLPDADHTFSDDSSRRAVERLTIGWLNSHHAAAGA